MLESVLTEREKAMFEESEVSTLEGDVFEADWDAFIADIFFDEPESDGWASA